MRKCEIKLEKVDERINEKGYQPVEHNKNFILIARLNVIFAEI